VRPDLPTNCGSPDWSRYADQGYYFAGDGAKYDSDGAIWLLGRVDDVMNVSGHRISTTEIESALLGVLAQLVVDGGADRAGGETADRAVWGPRLDWGRWALLPGPDATGAGAPSPRARSKT
jgi:acyl-CoA synthetase (AMP-forming)/AMP-acid ligase II